MTWRNPMMAAFFCLSIAGAQAAETPLSVSGLVAHPLMLSLSDLRAFPPTHIAVTQASGRGPVPLNCTGAAVSALLEMVGPALGAPKNASLAHTILVTADDGYVVALSFGEMDPNYGGAAPIIATDCDGKPLDAPRLVVPGDKNGGRAVRGVVRIEVR